MQEQEEGPVDQPKTEIGVDNQMISIDSIDLEEICKNPNIFEIEYSQRGSDLKDDKKSPQYDSEINSIIGSINSFSKEIK